MVDDSRKESVLMISLLCTKQRTRRRVEGGALEQNKGTLIIRFYLAKAFRDTPRLIARAKTFLPPSTYTPLLWWQHCLEMCVSVPNSIGLGSGAQQIRIGMSAISYNIYKRLSKDLSIDRR